MKSLILLFLYPFSVLAQQPNLLKINDTAKEYQVKKEESKLFTIYLSKNKTYSIHAEQKGIDIALTLTTKEGKKIQYQDSPNGEYGPEIIEYTPNNSATYILNITPLPDSTNALTGKFSIAVKEIPTLNNQTYIKTILSPHQMQEDVNVFKNIRIQANSGLYRYRTKKQIDSIYNWVFSQIKKPLPVLDFYRIIITLTDFEGSAHNWTELPYDTSYYLQRQYGFFPYCLKYIDGKIIINNVNEEIPLGSKIVSINGIADTSIVKALYKYRTTDGYNVTRKEVASVNNNFDQNYQIEFGAPRNFIIQYTLPNSTNVTNKTIKSISFEQKGKNYLYRNSAKYDSTLDYKIQDKYSFKILNLSTALLNIRIFTMASNAYDPAYTVFSNFLDSIFKVMKYDSIQNLIIDIRHNPGGNDPTYEKVFTYLSDSTFRENTLAYVNFKTIPFPEYYAWNSSDKENQKNEQSELESGLNKEFSISSNGRYLQNKQYNPYYHPDSNRFTGNLYLLVDEYVGSAASHFASLIKGYTNAAIVGKETAGGYYGHNGHRSFEYDLPNSKIKTGFSIVFVEQDAPKKQSQPFGRGIIPDYEVSQSLTDFLENKDTQMEFALKLIDKK